MNSEFHIPNSEFSNARWARLILRKPDRISGWISFPADAFSAQRPSFRATSLLFRKKERTKVKGGKRLFPIDKIERER